MRTPLWWLCYATWAIVSIYIAWRIDCDVPEPYMVRSASRVLEFGR